LDFKSGLRAIRKHLILVIVATLVGIGAGAYVVFSAKPRYLSSVAFFISTPATDDASALAADQFATRRVNSYVRLARSDLLADRVKAASGVNLASTSISREITASADLNTVLLRVQVVDPDSARSLKIASAIATELPAVVSEIDAEGSKARTVKLTVVSGPRLSRYVIKPSRALNLGLGLIVGLAVGIAFAVLRELLDSTLRSQEALRDTSGHPVLGSIRFDNQAKTEPLLIGERNRSSRAESFRQLRTNLQFMNVDHPTQVIVVTSSVAAEGKSTTAVNLALVFAETGRRTLLIEADMRRPRVAEYLGLERSVGLSNVLVRQIDSDDVLQSWGDGHLSLLAGGTIPPNPSELMGSQTMVDLMTKLRKQFDMIIIDTPPLLPVTDAAVASVLADGVVIVTRYGKTTRAQLISSVQSLEAVDARILGSVLTFVPAKASASQGGYDGYGYYEDASEVTPAVDSKIQVDKSGDAVVKTARSSTPVKGSGTTDLKTTANGSTSTRRRRSRHREGVVTGSRSRLGRNGNGQG
jgi:capsular exopolysaccharide synthesis family protein